MRQGVRPGIAVLLACAFAACVVACPVHAASLNVAPVRVQLTPARPIAALTLGNNDEAEVAVQAQVFAWSQENGQDVYAPTSEVLVNPAIFRIPPKGQQIVRLGLQVPAAEIERSYRIFLQQLPREQPPSADAGGGARLQTLLRIGIPMFVPATPLRQHNLQWRLEAASSPHGGPVLHADNQGSEHVQLTRVVVRRAGGNDLASKTLSHYVLAGRSSSLPLQLPALAPDTVLHIEADSDTPSPLPTAVLSVPRADAKPR
jgi:fimbrial chaperone protein